MVRRGLPYLPTFPRESGDFTLNSLDGPNKNSVPLNGTLSLICVVGLFLIRGALLITF